MVERDELVGAPSSEPSDPRSGSRWRSIPITVAAVAVAAVVIVGFLFVQSNSDKSDAEDRLAEIEVELAEASDRFAASEQEASDLQTQLTDTQTQLTDTQTQLTDAVTDLANADEDLADMSRELGRAEAVRQGVIDFLAVGLSVGTSIEESGAACMAESMAAEGDIGEILKDFAAAGTATDPNDLGLASLGLKMLQAADECGVPFDAFGATQPGFRYGDNPVLDSLQDQCAAGNGFACDQLFAQSEVGSEYEAFGNTCGNRFSVESTPFSCVGQI